MRIAVKRLKQEKQRLEEKIPSQQARLMKAESATLTCDLSMLFPSLSDLSLATRQRIESITDVKEREETIVYVRNHLKVPLTFEQLKKLKQQKEKLGILCDVPHVQSKSGSTFTLEWISNGILYAEGFSLRTVATPAPSINKAFLDRLSKTPLSL